MQPLRPVPNLPLRIGLFAGLATLVLISPGRWPGKIVGLAVMAFLAGSFRRSSLGNGRLETQLVVAFFPFKRRRYRLDRFESIEVGMDQPAGCGMFLLLFFFCSWVYWLWFRVLDFLVPWLGGRYHLWLLSERGRRVLVWQGNGESTFKANLDILEKAARLPVGRARDT